MKDFSKEYEAIKTELEQLIFESKSELYIHPKGSQFLGNIFDNAIKVIDECYRCNLLKLEQLASLIRYLHDDSLFDFNGKLYVISKKIIDVTKKNLEWKNYSLLIKDLYQN